MTTRTRTRAGMTARERPTRTRRQVAHPVTADARLLRQLGATAQPAEAEAEALDPRAIWQQETAREAREIHERHVCVICGAPFTGRDSRSKYCGTECAVEGARRLHHAKYSGVGKGGATRGKQIAPRQTCESCGKHFYATPSLIRRGGGRFCSYRCKGIGTRGAANHNYKGKVSHLCPQCGQTFDRYPSAQDVTYCSDACLVASRTLPRHACEQCGSVVCLPSQKYCGSACYTAARHERAKLYPGGVEVNCEVCNLPFRIKPAVVMYGQGRFCSRKCFGIWKAQHAEYGHSRARGGRRPDLDNRYFRSTWEANYARYLNWLITRGAITGWEYEVKTFEFPVKRGKARFYTPDFQISNLNGSIEYHEIKGWMDAESAAKLKRMTRYFPAVKVVLIDKDAYYAIARTMRDMLPGWERATEKIPRTPDEIVEDRYRRAMKHSRAGWKGVA